MDDRGAQSPSIPPPVPPVQQPKPQALPQRSGPNALLVSPRQKGNPILNGVKAVAWEYSDIPADYVLGTTTCALFLSLKYHRLHPEYIYNRIRDLRGQYQLRVLLTLVDIDNHEESLRELSKTSLHNNVTVMLCWSAQEAGRYLELFKTFEHTAPTAIRAHQSTSYPDKLVEFITTPRSINKTDAVGLVSNFGSVRTAVNAGPDEVALIAGWGEKKVQRWCNTVREPFRVKKAAKRGMDREDSRSERPSAPTQAPGTAAITDDFVAASIVIAAPAMTSTLRTKHTSPNQARRKETTEIQPELTLDEDEDEEDATRQATGQRGPLRDLESRQPASDVLVERKNGDEELSEGVMAALAKLRQQG
ncbi:DNA repair protein rad10 [Mytilinidion resinicola]|uniref:DNA repair protein rad10 n=1 Tax=Mytilinidion resinicola TaxID=574789 RepID=A0A6A6YWZ9_9PEZI|nr:DNA repair protein rad10 [Mytilinidion resinicola]KAF2813456.1 DNA repair protein rad10 [Mytilinidion resinicola]